ncbi:hypothetical protein HMI01_17150 [Halolactibacillus miurensis]|nr:6-hydroxymethylpterin diphosphokinase MptE-like protein [Halolactibacillus miurensis]GEM04727.1 hypothetical protein HMI01_17150 [Halolactibacillus miurensis]
MIVEVIETKNKQETLKVKLEDRELFIHSSYNPEREAQHILKKELTQDFNSDTHVVFLGLGLGYHVSQFTKQYQQNSYSIIEPSLEIFNVASDLIQLEEVFNKNVAHLFVGEMYSVRQIVDQIYKESATRVEIVISPTYKQLFSKLINEFVSESKKMIRQKRSELATNYNFQFNWIENSIKNHKHVLNTPNILDDSFKERFSDKPVIIVSAGPSLSDDIESIRSIKQNNLAYIFSVGSAINTLITYDVIPDAVFSYDPGDKNHLVFEKMIDQDKDAIPLVYGSSVGHQLLENFRGPKYHFITSQDYTSRLLLGDQIGKNELVLDSPSIAVMTFQIVNKLGMSPIIFAGQNLGYLYNRRYAQGVDYDFIDSELTEQEVDHAEEVKDVYGNNIKTNIGFNSMRNALVQFASTFKGEYYNTTKGGAAIEGIPFKTIEDLLNDNLQQSIDKKIWPINKKSYDLSDYDKKKEDIQLSYESFVEEKARLEYTLNKIKEETGKKKLEKLFTKIDNELTKFENNQFFTHFIVQSIRVEHDLLIQKINRVAKKETTDKKKEIIQMFRGYNASLTTVLVKLVLVLQEEGILNNGNAKTERNLV